MLPVQTVRIIASCTQGKKRLVPQDLRLGDIPDGSLVERLQVWKKRLQQSSAERVAVAELYRGQHWAVVRDLPTVAQNAGLQADLWITSAGYGLVPVGAQICSYSATFASSVDDSVWRPSDGDRKGSLRAWWRGLQNLSSQIAGAPRSLSELADAAPKAVILVIASPAYVTAMADDLAVTRQRLTDPNHLIVISSRNSSLPLWLESHLVPSEAPLCKMLGGSRGSLHARTARRILEETVKIPLRADVLVPRYGHLLSNIEMPAPQARLRLTDENVRRFIRETIAAKGNLSCTAVLRKLRVSGQACEQRRFAGLYAQVKGKLYEP